MAIVSRKNPNIQDHLLNPTFFEPLTNNPSPRSRTRRLNSWCHFWNMIGARNQNIRANHFYSCSVCGIPIQKKEKTYKVCDKHRAQYLADIRTGKILHPATFEVYAC